VLEDAADVSSGPPHVGTLVLLGARARLEAARGRVDDAVVLLETLLPAASQRSLEMMYLRVRPTLAPLMAARGERQRALELVAAAVSDADAWRLRRSTAEARLAQGLVSTGDEAIVALREAVALFAGTPARYDEAVAHVELGTALRRARHAVAARDPLARGMDLAARCGAAQLVERAAAELHATGARPRRVAVTGAAALTASELRVARLAAQGHSNRSIAETLFVSRKTVEKHLGAAYQKLGISSRADLLSALDSPAPELPERRSTAEP
jgi:DNA-binding CsgD family transcriptional regulator